MPDEFYCSQCDYIFSAAEEAKTDVSPCPSCGAFAAKVGGGMDEFEDDPDKGKYPDELEDEIDGDLMDDNDTKSFLGIDLDEDLGFHELPDMAN